MTAEEEQQIRKRAYSIWEKEGRPHGRDLDHRLRAEAEIAAGRGRGGVMAHQPDVRGGHRERLTGAAEALFTPKQQLTEQSTKGSTATAGEPVRKSRVLPTLPKAAVHQEELEPPIGPKPATTANIARSQFARIRTLVRYGMTARQVAEVYGVTVGEIDRILRRA
jgi:hypothetical protein